MSFFLEGGGGHKVVFYLEQHKQLAFPRRQGNQACWMRRSGHNLSIPLPSCLFLGLLCFLLEVAHLCDLLIIQIRCRDPWIVLAKKGYCAKVVNREWKIEKNNKEQVQYRALQNAPWKRYKGKEKQEGGIFHKELKKAFSWLQFDESKQTLF